jgi:cytosine/adenosine deaminase-related metal-dependent hydrolase
VRVLTARWVFPVAGPPILDGAVAIAAGEIAAVGRREEIASVWPEAARWDLGQAAVLPGLVNCHTHLEIAPLPASPSAEAFVSWVIRLIETRRTISAEEQSRAAEAGVQALLRSGTTTVGEVTTAGRSLAPLLRAGLRGVVYRELVGIPPEEAAGRTEAARIEIEVMRTLASGSRIRIGLSPHSPYALSEALLSACGELVKEIGAPPAIHAAESPEEVEYLTQGTGPIPRLLYPAVGCAEPPPRGVAESPVAYLVARGVLAWGPLLIHAVHVTDRDGEAMARHGVGVAHCPRSNARLSRGTAPVPRFLARGIPVGLGTDSLGSVPSLDLWDEMRAALAVHEGRLNPSRVLEMATLGGARVLGMADRVGSLEPGKRADLIAVAARGITAAEPVGSLLRGTRAADVLCSLIEGELCYARPEVPPCV